jgi:hypothetical protein
MEFLHNLSLEQTVDAARFFAIQPEQSRIRVITAEHHTP